MPSALGDAEKIVRDMLAGGDGFREVDLPKKKRHYNCKLWCVSEGHATFPIASDQPSDEVSKSLGCWKLAPLRKDAWQSCQQIKKPTSMWNWVCWGEWCQSELQAVQGEGPCQSCLLSLKCVIVMWFYRNVAIKKSTMFWNAHRGGSLSLRGGPSRTWDGE